MTNCFKSSLLLILLLLMSPFMAAMAATGADTTSVTTDQVSKEKLAAIKQLIDVTGAAANSQQFSRAFAQQMVAVLRINNPDISEKAIKIVHEEVQKMVDEEFTAGTLQQEIYPIYARHFTLEELKGLVAFNQSPAGQKANQVMPELMKESTQAARNWSRSITPKISNRVLQRFKEEGIVVKIEPPKTDR